MQQSDFDNKQTHILNNLMDITIRDLEKFDISHLVFNVSGEALKASKYESIKKLFRTIVFNVVRIEYTHKDDILPLIISYNYHREDHTKYWEKFKRIVSEYNEIYIEEGRKNYCKIRSLREMFSVISKYYYVKKQIKKIDDIITRRIIATNLSDLIAIKKRLDQYNNQEKAAFIFFDGNRTENLIVQSLRNKGIKVATMQHGQPVFHGKDVDRINQTMILNFSSDYIMVTGNYSKKQFLLGGVPEERIFVGGSLREVEPVKYESKDFVLFLDCPTYPNAARDNKELMECARKISELLDSHYVIKCHPQDDPQNYADFSDKRGLFVPKGTDIKKVLEGKGFGILHASGVYLDIIAEGKKAFCYVNNTDFPLVEEEMDSFSIVNELVMKIKAWDILETNKKQEYMNKVIDYYLSPKDAQKKYKEFVVALNERKQLGK